MIPLVPRTASRSGPSPSRSEPARAKINLALHITGRRADGYHLLDTLVAFPDIADRLTMSPAPHLSLSVTGPFAAALGDTAPADNLVLRAARLVAERAGPAAGAALTLEKHLPVASGIGGGSADAAAALRLLAPVWGLDPAGPALASAVAGLGADVPMCVLSRPARARGIGEILEPLASPLPDAGVLLVNPGVAVATPAVFRALQTRENPPLPDLPARFATLADLAGWMAAARNDLEPPAREVAPVIGVVLDRLRALSGARVARLSGSGATCFALFDSVAGAQAGARMIAAAEPGWWTAAAGWG